MWESWHFVSASECSTFTHRIAIQMAAQGRFLICLDCELRFEFPFETSYLATAEQFTPIPCSVGTHEPQSANRMAS